LSAGAYVLFRFAPRGRRFLFKSALVVTFGGVLFFAISQSDHIQQYFLKHYYFRAEAASLGSPFRALDELPDVERAYSPYQKIDIVHNAAAYEGAVLNDAFSTKYDEDPTLPHDRYLFLNGDFQLNSDYEELYHEWFAHVPIILNGEAPKRVLVMGAGDGMLLRELVKHDGIVSIQHVDLDPRLVGLAKSHPTLTALNEHALDDPRIQTVFGDAFQFVRKSKESYDAIYLDFPYVMDYNLSKLYSREFFHFVKARLSEGGFAVLDAPASNMSPNPDLDGNLRLEAGGDTDIYYNTIRSAGFESVVPFHTRLEIDNPRAFEILEDWSMTPTMEDSAEREDVRSALRREWMRQFIHQHATNLEQGFILMWNDDRDPTVHTYRDLNINLRMLNAQRFALAFPPPFSRSEPLDPFLVNSILRPTLPNRQILSVRRPW
jgi:Spermine/spermidine synthase domain